MRGKRRKPAQAASCAFSAVLRSHCSVGCSSESLTAAPCPVTFLLCYAGSSFCLGLNHLQSSLDQPWQACSWWPKGRQEPHPNANSKTHSLLSRPQDPRHGSETCLSAQTDAPSPHTHSCCLAGSTGERSAAARAAGKALQYGNIIQQRLPSCCLPQTLAQSTGQLPGLFGFYL